MGIFHLMLKNGKSLYSMTEKRKAIEFLSHRSIYLERRRHIDKSP